MPSTIKSLSVTYDPSNNEANTFASGDIISGRVTLETAKETEVNSFFVKVKGKARVLWAEHVGQITMVFYNKETIFKTEHFFIQEKKSSDEKQHESEDSGITLNSGVIPPGSHVYPFTFQIPQQDIPSSFDGIHGKVVYFLEAKLSRPMRISSNDKTEFTVLSKTDRRDPDMKEAQLESTEKKLHFLNSGEISISANIDSIKYCPGDEVIVKAEIHNNSSRAIKPKCALVQEQSNYALKTTKVVTKDIVKDKGEPIEPSAAQTVTFTLTIPSDVTPTFVNCTVLKVEYKVKVYMDIKFSRDPTVKFPVTILGPLRSTDGAVAGATGGVVTGAPGDVAAGTKEEEALGATGGATGGATAPLVPTAPMAPGAGFGDNSSREGAAAPIGPAELPPSYDSIYTPNISGMSLQ